MYLLESKPLKPFQSWRLEGMDTGGHKFFTEGGKSPLQWWGSKERGKPISYLFQFAIKVKQQQQKPENKA